MKYDDMKPTMLLTILFAAGVIQLYLALARLKLRIRWAHLRAQGFAPALLATLLMAADKKWLAELERAAPRRLTRKKKSML